MPLGDVLIHEAVPVSTKRKAGERIEGEYDYEPVLGTAFDAFLILPNAPREGPPTIMRGRREVTVPTLLYEPEDVVGGDVILKGEDDVDVTAEELAGILGAETVRWQVVGDPQPFVRPGELVGFQAQLRRVVD